MGALAAVTSWDVPTVSAAVVGWSGDVLETAGPTDHRFALASVTKLLTALAVLVAVEEESVALDDSAGPPGSTLRHLLAHASGLAFDSSDVLSAPGARRVYSNVGIDLAAALVEERTGLAFAAYVDEAVLGPLEMTSTELEGAPAAGAVSTVADLSRFAAELMQPTLVSAATLAEATSVVFPGLPGVLPGIGAQEHNDWGLGFEIRDGKSPHWTGSHNSPATFGHFGGSGTFLWVDADARLACVVLGDRDFDRWAMRAWPELSDSVIKSYAEAPK